MKSLLPILYVLPDSAMFSPKWILWTITRKSIGTAAAPVVALLGLWQRTHYSVWLRFSPWSARRVWHWLHLAMSTTWRRFRWRAVHEK